MFDNPEITPSSGIPQGITGKVKIWFTGRVKGFSPLATTVIAFSSIVAGIVLPIIGGVFTFWLGTKLWSKHTVRKETESFLQAREINATAIANLTGKGKKESAIEQLQDLSGCTQPPASVNFSILGDQIVQELYSLVCKKNYPEFEKKLCQSMTAFNNVCGRYPSAHVVMAKLKAFPGFKDRFSKAPLPTTTSFEFLELVTELWGSSDHMWDVPKLDELKTSLLGEANKSIDSVVEKLTTVTDWHEAIPLIYLLKRKYNLWIAKTKESHENLALLHSINKTLDNVRTALVKTAPPERLEGMTQYMYLCDVFRQSNILEYTHSLSELGKSLGQELQFRSSEMLSMIDEVNALPEVCQPEILQGMAEQCRVQNQSFEGYGNMCVAQLSTSLHQGFPQAQTALELFRNRVLALGEFSASPSKDKEVAAIVNAIAGFDRRMLSLLLGIGKRYLSGSLLNMQDPPFKDWLFLCTLRAQGMKADADPIVSACISKYPTYDWNPMLFTQHEWATQIEEQLGLPISPRQCLTLLPCPDVHLTDSQRARVGLLLKQELGNKTQYAMLKAKESLTDDEVILMHFSGIDLPKAKQALEKLAPFFSLPALRQFKKHEKKLIAQQMRIWTDQRLLLAAQQQEGDRPAYRITINELLDLVRFPPGPPVDREALATYVESLQALLPTLSTIPNDDMKKKLLDACNEHLATVTAYRENLGKLEELANKGGVLELSELQALERLSRLRKGLPKGLLPLSELEYFKDLDLAIDQSKHSLDMISGHFNSLQSYSSGDIVLSDTKLQGLHRYDVAQSEKTDQKRSHCVLKEIVSVLHSKDSFDALTDSLMRGRTHAGIIDVYLGRPHITEVGSGKGGTVGRSLFDHSSAIESIAYRANFTALLTPEGAAALQDKRDIQAFLTDMFGDYLRSFALGFTSTKTYSSSRAVYSYILEKASRLPKPIEKVAAHLGIKLLFGKPTQKMLKVYKIPTLEEKDIQDSILCSEFVAIALDNTLESMNHRLNMDLPQPHQKIQFFKTVFPESLDLASVHLKRLEELIQPFFTIEQPPLILGTDHPLLQRS